MNVLDFIFSNYQVFLSAFSAIVGFIVCIISYIKALRQKKYSEILSKIPEVVAQIESIFPHGNGDIKLGFVLRSIERMCNEARVSFDKSNVLELVEKVLSAPTKNKSNEEV